MTLQSVKTLSASDRNSAIDIFRAIAIIGVILFHFNNTLPYGFLGVDLFFVISGFLVSSLLSRKILNNEKINFWQFFLQRGFKIWPSYISFLLIGNLLAYLFYRNIDPSQLMEPWELKKYIFFYKNFSMDPVHSVFDQAWSLCVEEHFYIVLPLTLVILQTMRNQKKAIFILTIAAIFCGIACKIISFYFSNSGDTTFKTYNRMDGLAWGVLLNLILTYYPHYFEKIRRKYILFFAGFLLLIITMIIELSIKSAFFHKVGLFTLLPFCFFLMMAGLYSYNFKRLKLLRFIAYYSYNWYLWHAMFVGITIHFLGSGIFSLLLYMAVSFAVAMFFTILIEENFLRLRKRVFNTYFNTKLSRISEPVPEFNKPVRQMSE